MKTFFVRNSANALLLISSLCWVGHVEAETHKGHGQVTAVQGVVTLKVTGQPDQTLKAGMEVPEGGVIVTSGSGASVDIFLGRNTGVVRMDGDSELRVAKLEVTDTGSETVTDTRLVLQKGQLFGHVNKQSAASSYELTLPDGTALMQETRFQAAITDAAALGKKLSTVRVLEGQATILTRDGAYASVGPRQEWSPTSDGPSGTTGPMSPTMATLIGQAFLTLDVSPPAGTENPVAGNSSPTPGDGNVIQVAARPITIPPQETPLSPTTGRR